ncbi:hypothetical protein PL373_08050 [Tenacibaculum maritimum]|nr:hypothetical protein [Tenacibaculum maritimum]MDB0601098.1 hypothetical protein [Tenacibaculum maritimum]MDB0612180.1 hypothetical protein [Tenacibaculum maritimum]
MSKELTKTAPKESSLQQWKAKQQETLVLSKLIVEGKGSLAAKEMQLTISDTLSKPILKTVFKSNATLAFSVTKVLVKRFLNSFAFATKLTDDQIDILTVDALDKFSHESLEDILLFFKMARSGKFGTTKRGVNSNLIFSEWFPMYLDLKSRERETVIENQKKARIIENKGMKDVYITYKQAMLRRLKQQEKEYINDFTKNMDRQILEDTIVSWSNDKELLPYVKLLKKKRRTITK